MKQLMQLCQASLKIRLQYALKNNRILEREILSSPHVWFSLIAIKHAHVVSDPFEMEQNLIL